jgi:hypothetical protein
VSKIKEKKNKLWITTLNIRCLNKQLRGAQLSLHDWVRKLFLIKLGKFKYFYGDVCYLPVDINTVNVCYKMLTLYFTQKFLSIKLKDKNL